MKIVYLSDQKIYNKVILHAEINAGPNGQHDYNKSSISPTTLIQLKEEFESILDQIEENMDLK
ncbi:MAG: hypothetical protein WBP41_02825 [Saprospiraceae bacterium]